LRRDFAFQGTDSGFHIVVKRNCSIAPAALWRVFGLIALVSISIGTGFAMAGAWLILPFAGLEIAALGLAFLLVGRHAGDYERIELDSGSLTVEIADADRTERYRMNPREARVGVGSDTRVVLGDLERTLEIGRHLDAEARAGFGAELARRLQR
jgi:uncharacterized membrane protein